MENTCYLIPDHNIIVRKIQYIIMKYLCIIKTYYFEKIYIYYFIFYVDLVLKKHFLLLSMLKTVVLLNIVVKTVKPYHFKSLV